MAYIKIFAVITLIGSIAWLFLDPGFEPALAVVGAISALISAFVVEKRNRRRARQNQFVSKSFIGVQADGDVNIGNISGDNRAK